jgi:predicted AAA+ superfamily ATPase
LAGTIARVSASFPVLLLTGPRQVGKTTLLEACAEPGRGYVTLDDLDQRALAQADPALFLQTWPAPVLIDEVQYAPQLFSAIKLHVDRHRRPGDFWLTGSQKFHLMKGISESLAGRVAILDLLGLSQAEAAGRGAEAQPFVPTATWLEGARRQAAPVSLHQLYERIWLGSFPALNEQGPPARELFFRSYVQTYLQRDVPELLRVSDLLAFNRFLAATAARTAASLGLDGVSSNTASGISCRAARALSSRPTAFTPASVTISGRVMPTRWHSACNCARAPNSIRMLVTYRIWAMGVSCSR